MFGLEHSEIQSVLFRKDKNNLDDCILWLHHHNLRYSKVDEKAHYYRFRQTPPKRYSHFTTKTIDNRRGIKFVIGWG